MERDGRNSSRVYIPNLAMPAGPEVEGNMCVAIPLESAVMHQLVTIQHAAWLVSFLLKKKEKGLLIHKKSTWIWPNISRVLIMILNRSTDSISLQAMLTLSSGINLSVLFLKEKALCRPAMESIEDVKTDRGHWHGQLACPDIDDAEIFLQSRQTDTNSDTDRHTDTHT